jgi:hypothetical protein|tara:strand:+ start:138 stop:329 length:192 start_codon:yes stop_codon:yes gene_type:complete
MTTESNITITMQDVDVVRQLNPAFSDQLLIASVARTRAENTQRIEDEVVAKSAKKVTNRQVEE